MARPVTPDVTEARRSMPRLLELDPTIICPGHRTALKPLRSEIQPAVESAANDRWPLFG